MVHRCKVEKNPALRSLAKLFLISAWGKFAQNPQKTETRSIPVSDGVAISQFFNSPMFKPKALKRWGSDFVFVARTPRADVVKPANSGNIVYGAKTTSAARVQLYKASKIAATAESCGARNLIYCDTDSVNNDR